MCAHQVFPSSDSFYDLLFSEEAHLRSLTKVLALVGLMAASALGLLSAPATAGYLDHDTCRLVHDGKAGHKGDYVVVHRKNYDNGSTLLYRDHDRIRIFATRGIQYQSGFRTLDKQIRCPRINVRSIDRILIRIKRGSRTALIIDQSGKGLRAGLDTPIKFRGTGGPFAPGASGRGIRVEMRGQSSNRGNQAYLVFEGSNRDDHLYLSREKGLVSLRQRTDDQRSQGGLVDFNTEQIKIELGGGDDLLEAGGLGPDPDFNSFDIGVFAGAGDDRLLGHEGRDREFLGGKGNDFIDGRRGNDRDTGNGYGLIGGPGDDVIIGGPGNDVIEADKGHDIVRPGSGRDEVHAFDHERDEIDCEGNQLTRPSFDQGLDVLIDCPGARIEE